MATSKLYSSPETNSYCIENELRLVLIGKTGSGKSSLGNTLLAKEAFPASSTGDSTTRCCSFDDRIWNGRRLIVLDTPGMFDTIMPNEEVMKEVGKSIAISCPGPHAVLLAVNGSVKFTQEEYQTVKLLKAIFGHAIINYTIVVFTREDQMLKKGLTMKQWLEKAPKELKQVLDECEHRYLTINNDEKDRNVLDEKLAVLNEKIQDLLRRNNGDIYTNEMYEIISSQLKKIEEDAQRAAERRLQTEEQETNTVIQPEDRQERIRQAGAEAREQGRRDVQDERGDIWQTILDNIVPLLTIIRERILRPLANLFVAKKEK